MNLTSALSNAASGLAATSRLADTISNNVANAMTPGFAKRTTELSSLAVGGYGSGVRVAGTQRTENAYLTAVRRSLDAALGATGTRATYYERMMNALGDPGSPSALASRATRVETALLAAVASPQSLPKLNEGVIAAKQLAQAISAIAQENVQLRTQADGEINRQVTQVNDALHAVLDINDKIVDFNLQGIDIGGLQDERSRIIDAISSIIPVRAVKRDGDQIAIYAQNGGVLLNGRVWELSFDPAPTTVTPELTVGAGLGELKQNQGGDTGPVNIPAGSGTGYLDGGSLGALFETRDRIVPELDAELDRYANDLIERFRDLLPAGASDAGGNGLFVDTGPGALTGLAGRIGINAAVDPTQGGEIWRLRDGLLATAPGEAGFGTYLQAMNDAMTAQRAPTGFVSQTAGAGSTLMASEISSFFAGKAARGEDDRAYMTAQQSVLIERELSETGVNTDSELQSLMLVEQTYAANARVLSTIDELMNLLLEI